MNFFKMNKPRGYQHKYIYYDERKEKLAKIEENAKRDLGMLPPKKFTPEDIRGKFVDATTHLKRRKQSGKKPVSYGVLIMSIILLLILMRYLYTGEFF
jgi:hypothetical protein